ncbi:cytochrome P450 [Crossiella equi]|uniref:Cytochrome P450 n=3 Tax=Crossiella equi TaxID=130796 RepID=A0ABS5AQC3_9PSEU|nr:cytochrome P450 [Crossiella equi]MBP2478769.1 cytochrome P450 [Crossiella equi]
MNHALPQFPFARAAGCPLDPPPAYADLREAAPLTRVRLWSGRTPWLLTRYEDQRAALADPRLSADPAHPDYPAPSEGFQAQGEDEIRSFVTEDDPLHHRHRRMFTAHFTVRRVERLAPRIGQVIDTLLTEMAETGPPADLVTSFALPMPSLVISELLGVPPADQPLFQETANRLIARDSTAEQFRTADLALREHLLDLLHHKEKHPSDDLLGAVLHGPVKAGDLTKQELAATAVTLLVAGHETTTNMTSLGTLALLQDPARAELLRTGTPAQVATAVEELLRYLSITHTGILRVATEDLTLSGHTIRAGEGVIIANPAANHDPNTFPTPTTLDLTRPNAHRHLSFGHGTHQCIGQNLARKELQLAYPALLRRFPNLHVTSQDLPFKHDMLVYGLHELPVSW